MKNIIALLVVVFTCFGSSFIVEPSRYIDSSTIQKSDLISQFTLYRNNIALEFSEVTFENNVTQGIIISETDTVKLTLNTHPDSYFGILTLTQTSPDNPISLTISTDSSVDSDIYTITDKKYKHLKLKDSTTLSESEYQWIGMRTKFWTTSLIPTADQAITFNQNQINIQPNSTDTLQLTLYSGPIESDFLTSEQGNLQPLLYHELWFWVTWIVLFLKKILFIFISIFKSHGLSIILLSVFVKLAMTPLIKKAEKWQDDVNKTKTKLQPRLEEIKTQYSGEEQHNKTMELYKEEGISPFYTIKSLASVFIQIPIFFAAYHMLGEEIQLTGVSFLWMSDISQSDALFTLPFSFPYFGNRVNVLPLIMTIITIASARVHTDKSLSKSLLKKQKFNLYSMSFMFFILFYNFLASMVLYWTMNNFLAFLKELY